MTDRQALDWFTEHEPNLITPRWAAYKRAAEVLRRRIPEKYKMEIDTAVCPECGAELERQKLLGENMLLHEQFRFCPDCGQAIDWKEEPEEETK